MCGRYSLPLRPSQVRAYLEAEEMQAYEAPEDEDDHGPRQSYNFAPGYNGIVYRADTPDWGAGQRSHGQGEPEALEMHQAMDGTRSNGHETRYKLQTMKWGLIPFWTKHNPDYGSMLRTINCRDDSLLENRGMWTTMKQKKRCIVIAQGFYEWLKKNDGKEKIPHFIKRKDDKLMCMAGLWDCVQYEGSDERLYTYTIITTDSNAQLKFLHDRMPVILENGSEELRTWLDPKRYTWSKELQSLLRPYKGELEIYPVSKDVGKVGNNSPTFIIPITSSKNKNNIANFFTSSKSSKSTTNMNADSPKKLSHEEEVTEKVQVKHEPGEDRKTIDHSGTEDNAPLPIPRDKSSRGTKRQHVDDESKEEPPTTAGKKGDDSLKRTKITSPTKSSKNSRSSTSNRTSPAKPANKEKEKEKGTRKITTFFGK